ncbi:GmrSD restriction endonuclease domain-containing protein [Streptomyces sp. CA-253872]|uniref:GmrSD restriction endonuclease domain-containing protein n=1 Tax=Streptomyces sp. CA-253872 TaxID=3240067 RepID=UPI003D916368
MIQSQTMTISTVFHDRRYKLDAYQRDFTWERNDVLRLVDDLHRKFTASWRLGHDRECVADYEPYFLGPFVYHDDKPLTYLVDGQQRVTTLHLLLIHLRELLRAQDLEAEADRLGGLIRSHQYGKTVYTLDIPERQQFLENVFTDAGYTLPEKASAAQRRLWEAARVFREEFPEELRGDALPYFVDWLLDGVCMVGIRAASRDQGWEIYESMNDRGVRLGPIDLLKSHLLAPLDENSSGAEAQWRQMVSQLAVVDVNAPSDFIKAFLLARYADSDTEAETAARDMAGINGPFHAWVKDNTARMGLVRASDHRALVHDLAAQAERFRTLTAAAKTYTPELPGVFFNAYNGVTRQAVPILAATTASDDSGRFKEKARLIADYLDMVFVKRLVNELQSSGEHVDAEAMRLAGLLRGGVETAELRDILAREISALGLDFSGVATYGLRSGNRRHVRYLLARLTGFIETGCGRKDNMDRYLHVRKPFEIEHIWADDFTRHQPETRTRIRFDSARNRLGALLLLPKSSNSSFQALPYEKKVDYYVRENQLAGSLHVRHRERNAPFNQFLKEHKLERLVRPFLRFDLSAIDSRQRLYQRLCEIIWNPARVIGAAAVPAQRTDPSRSRTRARYNVAVIDLVEKGRLPVRAELVGYRRTESFTAQVLDDGRIEVASGEIFGSLSAAGEFVLQTKSCPGWNFWRTTVGGQELKLVDIRKAALEEGLL